VQATFAIRPRPASGAGRHAVGNANTAESEHGGTGSSDDDTTCEYWRYCALDGFLCTCCGGSISPCPPGTEVSKVIWIGTCQNPHENKACLMSYNDCCGVTACARCLCNYNQGERPAYRMGLHNDLHWCMSNKANAYHRTVAVGVAELRSG